MKDILMNRGYGNNKFNMYGSSTDTISGLSISMILAIG